MATILSILVDNLAAGIHKIMQECRNESYNKTYKPCGIKYKDCQCCLEYTNAEDNIITIRLFCNKIG